MYEVKKAQYSSRSKFYHNPLLGANLLLTKGLTSLSRIILIGLGVFVASVFAHFILDYSISFNKQLLPIDLSIKNFLDVSIIFTSLFLGFGFTNFSTPTIEVDSGIANIQAWRFLVTIATLGLVWYALVLSIIIRRFYK